MYKQIKIQSDIRQKKGFGCGMSDRVEFPVLRLRGLWLMEAGIKPGQKVNVSIEHHLLYGSRLIIEPVKP